MPHLHAPDTGENLAQHRAEGILTVIERALPMRLEHDQPDEALPGQAAPATQYVRWTAVLVPFSLQRLRGLVELDRSAGGSARAGEAKNEPILLEVSLELAFGVELDEAL